MNTDISTGNAVALGLLTGSTLLFGIQLVPWIREELRTPEPEFQGGTYGEELVGTILMWIGLGISIDVGEKLVSALVSGEWPEDLL